MTSKYHTYQEIFQQPKLWLKVFDILQGQRAALHQFITPFLSSPTSEIIFTGAGSSFFIGEMVAGVIQKKTGVSCRAISTTEIVTHPDYHINKKKDTLMVSFARSGNSPESLAAVKLASKSSPKLHHIFISCNKEGALAKMPESKTAYLILLPEEANDKSLAMTSSVTSMAMVALLLAQLNDLEKLASQLHDAAAMTTAMLLTYEHEIKNIAAIDFDRAVFLGSGPMQGVAREAHLKLQELTDGKVISKFDSFLGFRHGPKAVVNEKTLMVYFFSNDDYVRKYEKDLVNSIKESSSPIFSLGIVDKAFLGLDLDKEISFSQAPMEIDESFWLMSSLVVIQLLAFYKSLALGLNPDSPSQKGSIHRVVQGVTIYHQEPKLEEA
jgi:tagatose-6-phosphate ketose/aldose isomerase